jgi:Fur family ferric uptake transcriptional regulator
MTPRRNMSLPRSSPVVLASDAAAALREVRDRGLRVTAARRQVIEALYATGRPVTAEEIASGMYGRFVPCDLASVYRNLEALEELGLVRHMHLGHGPGLYAPASLSHEYVACERCGRSQTVPADCVALLRGLVAKAVGYRVSFGHLPLAGLCPACQERVHVRA